MKPRAFLVLAAAALLAACTTILGATDVPPLADAGLDARRADASRDGRAPDATRPTDATRLDGHVLHDAGTDARDAGDAAKPVDAGNDARDTCAADGCAPTYASSVLADLPLGYWRLDEDAGATVAVDRSGNHHDGTYQGDVTWGEPGAIVGDTAVYLNLNSATNPTGYVSVAGMFAQFVGTSAFSIEAWIKPQSVDGGVQAIGSNVVDVDGGRTGWVLYVGGGEGLDLSRFHGGAEIAARDAGYAPSVTEWTHVVGTYGAGTLTVYVNGNELATTSDTQSVAAFTCTFDIGASHCGTTGFFVGLIDEVAVYSTVLPPERVKAHFNAAQ